MRSRRPLVLACLLAAVVVPAPGALAQSPPPAATSVAPPVNPGDAELDGGLVAPPGTTPAGTTPPGVAPDDAQALPPASSTQAPAGATPQAGGTPGPPAYLAPGPGAQVQPVAAVAQLRTADVPLEPLRIAALVAALLAVLLLGGAALLRSLGLRTVVAPIVPEVPHEGGRSPVRGRVSALADDVRDFLRHSR